MVHHVITGKQERRRLEYYIENHCVSRDSHLHTVHSYNQRIETLESKVNSLEEQVKLSHDPFTSSPLQFSKGLKVGGQKSSKEGMKLHHPSPNEEDNDDQNDNDETKIKTGGGM